ncbi:spinster family MFS transporter [Fibrella aquatilis]|uniref:MFS transporter n=1 Tax=Fibrella aquatilis TaxID=2817059 RepID=A0A939GCR6_9BACT|nr:MFS transporter [Fibrella aquatilis]MBO0934859.1 MFS transporter [Fibrella aquatilis]
MTPTTTPAIAPPTSLRAGWYTVAILLLAYISSFIDRQILSLLVAPIKRDFHLSDTQVSLLMGLSFALFYTMLGIPVGRWADRRNRRNLVVAGIAVWSLMTALCGLARGYGQFFLARVGVGVGEATLSPAAYSILADYFPKEKLATAISVYSAGIYIGSGLAVLLGAWLVSSGGTAPHMVTLPLVGDVFGWQTLFFYIGLPGLLISLLVLTVKEPLRRGLLTNAGGQAAQLSVSQVMGLIREKQAAFLCVTLGITFLSLAAYASSAWTPTYFVRTFGWTIGRAGAFYGTVVAIFSTSGILLGGRYADQLTRRGIADGKLRIGLYSAVGVALGSCFPLISNPTLAMALLPIPCFFVAFPFGASSAAIQALMPNQARALASAVYLFILNIIALGFGPTSVALLTDYVFHDEQAVRYSLAIVVFVSGILAFCAYGWGLKPYRKAVEVVL